MAKTKELETKKAILEDVKALATPQTPARQASLKRLENKLERPRPIEFDKGDSQNVTIIDYGALENHLSFFETTGTYHINTGIHLLNQVYNAQPASNAKWTNTAILMHDIAPQDTLEGMLASQMIACHNMAMEFSRRAMLKDQTMDGVERNINRATKLMRTFSGHVEALQKYRSKGQQQIIVKHQQVNVSDGGQAVIGDIHQGGG